jgi:hypothetical protein
MDKNDIICALTAVNIRFLFACYDITELCTIKHEIVLLDKQQLTFLSYSLMSYKYCPRLFGTTVVMSLKSLQSLNRYFRDSLPIELMAAGVFMVSTTSS